MVYIDVYFKLFNTFRTDYERIDASRSHTGIQSKSQMRPLQINDLQLVMADPRTRGQLMLDRKLPRTPEEYAELIRKAYAVESSRDADNGMVKSGSISNPDYPSRRNEFDCRPLGSHANKHQEPPQIPVAPPVLDNVSNTCSTDSEVSGPCVTSTRAARCARCIVLPGDALDNVNQEDVLPTEYQPGACPVTSSDNNEMGSKGYEKLNPNTMDSF